MPLYKDVSERVTTALITTRTNMDAAVNKAEEIRNYFLGLEEPPVNLNSLPEFEHIALQIAQLTDDISDWKIYTKKAIADIARAGDCFNFFKDFLCPNC